MLVYIVGMGGPGNQTHYPSVANVYDMAKIVEMATTHTVYKTRLLNKQLFQTHNAAMVAHIYEVW
jgi:hypothetical protein